MIVCEVLMSTSMTSLILTNSDALQWSFTLTSMFSIKPTGVSRSRTCFGHFRAASSSLWTLRSLAMVHCWDYFVQSSDARLAEATTQCRRMWKTWQKPGCQRCWVRIDCIPSNCTCSFAPPPHLCRYAQPSECARLGSRLVSSFDGPELEADKQDCSFVFR